MRRLLQVGANSEPPLAAVGLTVLRDMLQSNRTEMRQLIGSIDSKLLHTGINEDDDGEEAFVDDDIAAATAAAAKAETRLRYDPAKREPKFSMARRTPLWELFALASHVHPIVSHGAARIISGEPFPDVSDDPFQEFSVVELLERLTYSSRTLKTKLSGSEKGPARVPYNSKKFMKRKKIAPHERFFWLYFSDKTVKKAQRRKEAKKRQKLDDVDEEGGQDDDDDDDAEEQKDQFFDDYLQSQMPKGGDEEDGSQADDQDINVDDLDEDSDFDDSDGPEESEAGDGSEEEEDQGTKRKTDESEEEANPRKRMKALRKKHSSSVFASAEDFENMFDMDA